MTALWVVVPAYQEAPGITDTLAALAAQTDLDFTLVVVDNGSTDATAELAADFAGTAPFPVHVIVEPQKGAGSAVDTGFRFAIDRGAKLIARTDADCLPCRHWVAHARAAFTGGAGMVCGGLRARRDENGPLARIGFRVMVWLATTFGRFRPSNLRGYRVPYRMHAGNNMAITAELYLAVGGMPRRPSPTDRTFLNRVRAHEARIVYCAPMVVENSMRRIRTYGVLGTARWYLERGSGALTEDPRQC